MLTRLRQLTNLYPRQFWLLFVGMFISTLGASMVWPFLMIYASEKLALPLAKAASLMTLNAAMGLIFSFLAGPVIDRVGRKWAMVVSLIVNGLVYVFMSQANTFPEFAILMALAGAFNPLYRVGADAMMADIIPADQRTDAYALLRTSNNAGVALGPAIGGFLATISYSIAFLGAAAGMFTFSLLLVVFARETLPQRAGAPQAPRERWGGYDKIFQDRPFMRFIFMFTLTQMCATLIWVLLGVYMKQNYHVPETQWGLIATTNALMVVFFQLPVTQITKRYAPLAMLAVGSLFYAIGVGSIALGQGFWGFWFSMVVLTIGELILSPTSVAYTASLAPPDMRGRYMSLFGLTWGVAAGVAPVVGGWLNDSFGPIFIWYGGLLIGLVGFAGFLVLARRKQAVQPVNGN